MASLQNQSTGATGMATTRRDQTKIRNRRGQNFFNDQPRGLQFSTWGIHPNKQRLTVIFLSFFLGSIEIVFGCGRDDSVDGYRDGTIGLPPKGCQENQNGNEPFHQSSP